MELPLTPLDFQRRARSLYSDREAVVDGSRRFTYGQFGHRCDRWSAALQRLGVTKGDRIAYISPNTHSQLESFYAVPQVGAVLVPINFRLKPREIEYIIQHSGSTVVCAHADYLEAESGGFERSSVDECDLLAINYTSGTTSRPKGVMITHRNAYMNVVGTLVHLPMTCADRYLWTLPMFHANGWTFVWIVTAVGGTHVCLRKVDPAMAFRLIRDESVSMLCAAPTVLIGLATASPELRGEVPSGVRVLTAGAPPAAATIQRVEGELGWNLIQAYGLTETAPLIAICEPRPEHAALSLEERSMIKARQGVELITSGELRVVDEHDDQVPRDGHTLGEIVVRGNVVMDGYYNDPEATAEAMRGGWFHSGDAAVVHPDGYAEIRDRFKDVIISGGENISSVEVEGILMRHPAVQEVAVVGMPDPTWGETPHAFVRLAADAALTEADLIAYAREHMANFKAPRKVEFVTDLPKTATGKIQKYVLRSGRSAISAQ